MDFFTGIYFFYSFVAFYFLFLFILIYIQNKKHFLETPKITRQYSLSIVVPCYNEQDTIGDTIKTLLESDYKGLKKIIVVDDCSTDNSYEIIKRYAKANKKVMALRTPKNTGKASGSKNYGAKFVKTELIGFTDADSYIEKHAISNMIGFFDNKKVGAVTSSILVKKRDKLIEKLQSIEYKVIKFSRKLLEFIDAIYVTPGPLAIYKKSAFDDVGGFDESNLTEDIEITWHLQSKGYLIKMAIPARSYTIAPDNTKDWVKQRIRWNVGGLQTIDKYKNHILKRGMLGNFILPFFVFSWLLGIFGLGIFGYRIIRRIVLQYLSTSYSVQAQAAILTLREINLTPNVLVFFGLGIFFLSLFFTLFALANMKEKDFKRHGVFSVLAYLLFYLMAYPIILITSVYRFLRGKKSW